MLAEQKNTKNKIFRLKDRGYKQSKQYHIKKVFNNLNMFLE
jgi:hypothetical protein